MSTTAEVAQPQWFSTRRVPVLLALAALCAGVTPAGGQETGTVEREAPHRAAASRREARIQPQDVETRSCWRTTAARAPWTATCAAAATRRTATRARCWARALDRYRGDGRQTLNCSTGVRVVRGVR